MIHGLGYQVGASVPFKISIKGELLYDLEASTPEPMPVISGGQETD
jgi:hypothetical protein